MYSDDRHLNPEKNIIAACLSHFYCVFAMFQDSHLFTLFTPSFFMTFRSSLFLILPFLIFALLMCPVTAKDTHNPLLQHEIEMTEFFYPDNAVSHIYHADIQPDWVRPDAFWYEDTARDGSSFYSVNVTQGTKKRLFDSKKFTRSFEKATGKEVKTARLPLHDMDLSSDENFFSFSAYNDQWSCDLSNYFITKQSLPPEIQAGILSPD